jgi:hypothetical protein
MPRRSLPSKTPILPLVLLGCSAVQAHDAVTTKLTWNREISRIVSTHCVDCHRPGGPAFSLKTYRDARPWAKAIAEEVLERRMPPWGAVKGFGDFRDDRALTQEQLQLIAHWVEGGAPEGDPKDLAARPLIPPRASAAGGRRELLVEGGITIDRAIVLEGIWPKSMAAGASARIVAELPDGSIEPLVWLYAFRPRFAHPFYLRTPLELPRGAVIRGVPAGSRIALLISTTKTGPARRNARYSPRPSAGTGSRSDKSAPAER